MQEFSLMLKTFDRDAALAKRLLLSISKFNVDNIPVFIVCPRSDFDLFCGLVSEVDVQLVAEDSMSDEIFKSSEVSGLGSGVGFMNQQIYKLAFSNLGLCKYYLCLDSDAVFIRPFFKRDFIHERTNLPFLFQSEDRELRAERSYVTTWESREVELRKIQEVLRTNDGDPLKAVHGFQVFSSAEIQSMMSWLRTNAQISSFKEMLSIAPYEFNWYTTFVRTHSPNYLTREPIFRTFHGPRDYTRAMFFRLSEDDYSRGYVGVCVNGNFQHGRGSRLPLSLRSNASVVGGVYLSFGEIFRLAVYSIGALVIALAVAPLKLGNRLILILRRRFDSVAK